MIRKSKENGITLITLIVTIIIIIILAGITIRSISGDNGLIKKTQQAVDIYGNEADE